MQLHRLLYMEEVKWLKFMLSRELAVRPPMNDKKEAKLLAGNCVKLHREMEKLLDMLKLKSWAIIQKFPLF